MRGDREVYTPQVVVNGSVHALGSDKDAIEARHRVEPQERDDAVAAGDPDDRRRPPHGQRAGRRRRPHSLAEVWICGLIKAATVAIGRGENRGKTITYHNVARHWVKLGTWTGKAETWSVPTQDFDAKASTRRP